jgi:hypothetical protein
MLRSAEGKGPKSADAVRLSGVPSLLYIGICATIY